MFCRSPTRSAGGVDEPYLARRSIVVAEETRFLSNQICKQLESFGFSTACVDERDAVIRAVTAFRPCLILMSWSLIGASANEFCRTIRDNSQASGFPVLFITADPLQENAVREAVTDADGYILKPLRISTLLAKARPLFRRLEIDFDRRPISFQSLSMDPISHRVHRNGRTIHLGPTDYRLLEFLMRHPDQLFRREELLDAVWGPNVPVLPRTVDVHIRRLRKSINGSGEPDILRTVREEGYALDSASA